MRLRRRLNKLLAALAVRGDLDPPPTPPTREQRLERIGRRLRDVGSGALWGMHTPQLWPALRDWRDARASSPEARAKAYRALREPLLRAVAEHDLRRQGLIGRCNACPAINAHYGGRPHEVRPLPVCPACGLCHTDDAEALRLAAERMRGCWADRPGAAAESEADWAEVAMLVADGPPAELRVLRGPPRGDARPNFRRLALSVAGEPARLGAYHGGVDRRAVMLRLWVSVYRGPRC